MDNQNISPSRQTTPCQYRRHNIPQTVQCLNEMTCVKLMIDSGESVNWSSSLEYATYSIGTNYAGNIALLIRLLHYRLSCSASDQSLSIPMHDFQKQIVSPFFTPTLYWIKCIGFVSSTVIDQDKPFFPSTVFIVWHLKKTTTWK